MSGQSYDIQAKVDTLKSRGLSALEIYAEIRKDYIDITFKQIMIMYNKGAIK